MISRTYILVWAIALTAAIMLGGCMHKKPSLPQIANNYTVFHEMPVERRPIRRVVILPVENRSNARDSTLLEFQRQLAAKIRDQGAFEVVEIPDHALPACQPDWVKQGKFPDRLLVDLYHNYSADGVIFVSINRFHAYSPMSIAVTAHLVDTDESVVLSTIDGNWSMDDPQIQQKVKQHMQRTGDQTSLNLLLNSPRFMMSFVGQEIASELAKRQLGEMTGSAPQTHIEIGNSSALKN